MNSESAPVAIMERVPPRALEARPQADRAAVFSMRALRQVFLLAGKEFGDRLRSGWVLACVLVWLGAVIFTSLFGLVQIGHVGLQGYERTVVSLLNLVQYLVFLLGLLLGHDLVVGEREERTLPLLLAAGVSRGRLLLGKFCGGAATLAVPLGLGFAIAGAAIGFSVQDRALTGFLLLAGSTLLLGLVFLGIGLLISVLCRTRVRALVTTLLVWGVFVFVLDLVALGLLVSLQSPAAAQEIEVLCDTTHLNASVDIHTAFDLPNNAPPSEPTSSLTGSLSWVLLNPVALFRAVNLAAAPDQAALLGINGLLAGVWLAGVLGFAAWRMRRLDL
jgi:Cu-processing system permease protein